MKTKSKGHQHRTSTVAAIGFALALLLLNAQTTRAQWTSGTNINNTNSGNVGVGTSSPGEKLDVAGTIRTTGQSTAPASGAGIEISYSGGIGYIQSYDRAVSDTTYTYQVKIFT